MELLLPKLLLVVLALAFTGYFCAVEMAVISSRRWKLQHEARNGSSGAQLALGLLSQQEQIITTTLVGTNLATLTASSVATAILEERFGTGWAVTLGSTVGLTLVILVLGEMVPKMYGKQHAERLLILLARPVLATEQLLLPFTAVLRLYLALLLRLFRRAPRRPYVTRDELKALVHEVSSETGPGLKEKRMLRSILDFGDTTVREVMVPMTEVISIERESSVDFLKTIAKRHGFTRVPVYGRRIDRVIGVVNVYEVLFDPDPAGEIEPYIHPVPLVPETKRIDRLLPELQRDRQTLAVVVSEFGSCVGIVTVEDILEEIVGEISDEREVGGRKIRKVGPRTYVVNALTDVDDINEELGLELPKGRYDTLAGLVLKHFGRIPHEGEGFDLGHVRVEIVDVHPFGVRSVKLVLAERAVDEEGSRNETG